MAKHVFFIGKGGVGKSTLSALHALYLSKVGKNVLLVSMDPAHNQSDIFRKQFGEKIKKVHEGLHVKEVDEQYWLKKYLAHIELQLKQTYAYQTAFNLHSHFKLVKYSPGIEEYSLMLAFRHIRKKYAGFDFIVFDMPPTALTLKFFRLPSLSLVWLEKLQDLRKHIIKKRNFVTRISIGKREIERDRVLRKLYGLMEDHTAIQALLASKETSSHCIITTPDSLAESECTLITKKLQEIGCHNCIRITNKVEAGETGDSSHCSFPGNHMALIGLPALEAYILENIFLFDSVLRYL